MVCQQKEYGENFRSNIIINYPVFTSTYDYLDENCHISRNNIENTIVFYLRQKYYYVCQNMESLNVNNIIHY